jgi:hypothetical protein
VEPRLVGKCCDTARLFAWSITLHGLGLPRGLRGPVHSSWFGDRMAANRHLGGDRGTPVPGTEATLNHAMHTDSAITFRFQALITGAEPVMANR